MAVVLVVCVIALAGCGGRKTAVEAGLVKASDLSGNWTAHRHPTTGESRQDARLSACLGVEGAEVAKRVSGTDFNRDSATGSEQVSSTATKWRSAKAALAIRKAENGDRF